jgi:ketosteroid isomerase-like protein
MADDNVELVKQAYAAVNRRDFDAFLTFLDDDLEWLEPGPPGGPPMTFTKDRVATELLPGFTMFMPDIQIETETFVGSGDHVAMAGRFYGHDPTGAEHAIPVANFLTLRDGKVVRMRSFVDTATFLHATGWKFEPPEGFSFG